MMMSATYAQPIILEFSRENPEALLAVLKRHWEALPTDGIHFPELGRGSATVALFHDHVVKALKSPWGTISFERECSALFGLTKAITQHGGKATDLLGVDVPTVIAPTQNHDLALLVMSRVNGEPLWNLPNHAHHDWVLHKLAKFYVSFDEVMANQYPDVPTKNLRLPDMAKGTLSVPDFAAEIFNYLPYAMTKLRQPTSAKPRYMHNDLKPGNILVEPASQKVGIIDFGEGYYGDPHIGLSKLLSDNMAIYGDKGIDSSLRVIEEINRLSRPEPWVDVNRCIDLVPIHIFESIQRRIDEAAYRGTGLTQTEQEYCELAISRVKGLFERFNIDVAPESVSQTPKRNQPETGIKGIPLIS
jgi:Phosphotransferase enzyme family